MSRERGMSRWEALGILMVLAFLNYMDRSLLPPALNSIKKDLGLSGGEAGALATGFFAVYAFTAPLAGYLADRLSRRRILLFAVVMWSIVTALSGTATGFASLLLWRALTGLGEGGYFPTALSLIGDLFEKNQRGKAIALHGVCTTLGGAAGLALGGILVGEFGWRMPFFLAIAPGLVLAAVLFLRFQEPPRGQKEAALPDGAPPAARRSYLAIALSTPVLLISLAACAAAFSMNAVYTFLPSFLQDAHGLTEGEAGVLTGVAFAATMLGQLAGGFSSDGLANRITGVRPLLVAAAYLLAAPAVLGIALVPTATLVVAAYAITQVGRGFAEPNLYGTVMDSVPAHERGTAQGFLLAMTFAGSTAGPWVAGVLQGTSFPSFPHRFVGEHVPLVGALMGETSYTAMFVALSTAAAVSTACASALFVYLRRRLRASR
jgi:MFS family permease